MAHLEYVITKLWLISHRFEVFWTVTIKNAVFWYVTPFGCCKNRRFRGTYYLHYLGEENQTQRFSSSLWSRRTTRRQIPEGGILELLIDICILYNMCLDIVRLLSVEQKWCNVWLYWLLRNSLPYTCISECYMCLWYSQLSLVFAHIWNCK
jgi:hypothetical protein